MRSMRWVVLLLFVLAACSGPALFDEDRMMDGHPHEPGTPEDHPHGGMMGDHPHEPGTPEDHPHDDTNG